MSQKIASLYADIGADTSAAQKGLEALDAKLLQAQKLFEKAQAEFARTGDVSEDLSNELNKTGQELLELSGAATKADASMDKTSDALDENANSAGRAQNGIKALKQSYTDISFAIRDFAAMAKGAWDFARAGAEIQMTEVRFGRLSESIGTTSELLMRDLREATQGTISDMDLMASATDLVGLGLAKTHDEAVRLAKVAGALGMNMNQLVLTLTNQTTMRFDALGVSVDGFDEKVKQLEETGLSASEAFTEAFLRQAEDQIERIGNAADTTLGAYKKLEAEWKNISDEIKAAAADALLPSITAAGQLFVIVKKVREAADEWGMSFWDAYKAIMAGRKAIQYGPEAPVYGPQPSDYDNWSDWAAAGYGATQEVVDGMDEVIIKTTELQDALTAMGGAEFKMDFLIDYAVKYDEVQAQISANEAEINRLRAEGGSAALGKAQELTAENEKLKGSMQEYMNNLLFSFAQTTALAGGLTETEMKNLMNFGVELGIFSQDAADAATTAWGDYVTQAGKAMDGLATDTDSVWKTTTDHIVNMLEAIPNKVTVTVQKEGEGGNSSSSQSSGSGSSGGNMDAEQHATGGQLKPGHWSVVGERGWELISPTGYVYSHEQSKRMNGRGARPFAEGGQMADMDLSAMFDRLATKIIYGVRDAVQQVM